MKEIVKMYMSDYKRYAASGIVKAILSALFARNHCFAYSFWMRLASRKNIFYPLAKWMHCRLSRKYGIQIPPETKIGYGFYIGHGVGIVINSGTIIGDNCNVSQFLSIGTNTNNPAVIGNNVYIGPNVCIVEGVHIGDNVTIGAGAVVVKDIPENATVAGCPAKILNFNNPGQFIGNKFEK